MRRNLTNLGALSPGDEGLAQRPLREGGRGLDVIPVLLGERVDTTKRSRGRMLIPKRQVK